MSRPDVETLRWAARKRLEYIDFRLMWDGGFAQSDLVRVFGLTAPQALGDIEEYQRRHPEGMAYDPATKNCVRGHGYRPSWAAESADRYLLQMVAIEAGWMDVSETWFAEVPAIDAVGLSRPPTNPQVLLPVRDAIREQRELLLDYRSMTGVPFSLRTIAPHALQYNAGRWYARAWSREHNDYRDFSLNRIRKAQLGPPAPVGGAFDYEWLQKIELVIAPNPSLSPERRRAVEDEWDMIGGRLKVPVRLSLSFYLMAEHNLDVAPGLLKPEKQQLVLQNLDEVEAARQLARQMSIQALRQLSAKE